MIKFGINRDVWALGMQAMVGRKVTSKVERIDQYGNEL